MTAIKQDKLEKVLPEFRSFLESEASDWIDERNEKDQFFEDHLSREALKSIDEGTIRELIHLMWATNAWTNKDYLHKEMLKSGIDTIRDALDTLFYGDGSIRERFDAVQDNVHMMGAASISELLAHHDHTTYPIWNQRSKDALVQLGVNQENLPKSKNISGKQYAEFCEIVQDVFNEIRDVYPDCDDLFELDFLLYYISSETDLLNVDDTESVPDSEEEKDEFVHDDVIEQVLELGDGLGFEVEKEYSVLSGCRIDALWRTRIANLGTISYAFEVHHKGSRDSAILNLQRVNRDASIRKVIIISNEEELDKFRDMIESLGEDFRNAVGYFRVSELQSAIDHLDSLKEILNKMGLLRAEGMFD
jgi:hypothetical protein